MTKAPTVMPGHVTETMPMTTAGRPRHRSTLGELSMVTFRIRGSRLVPDTKRECAVRRPTSSEAVALAMNARVVTLCRDLSCDCFRYFTLGVLTAGEGVSEARTPPSLPAWSHTVRALRH